MKVGRNKPCHCGSGKKYKHCHEISKKSNNNQYVIIGLVAIVIVVVLFISTDRNESNKRTAISTSPLLNQPAAKSNSKPAGIAPPGKVWHEGHGHWHDAPLAASTPKKTSFRSVALECMGFTAASKNPSSRSVESRLCGFTFTGACSIFSKGPYRSRSSVQRSAGA